MAVYVDEANIRFGRMWMCHLMADTHDELVAMVDRIGVNRRWIQNQGSWREHFDICHSKRSLAISHGALQVTSRELMMNMFTKKKRKRKEIEENEGKHGPI